MTVETRRLTIRSRLLASPVASLMHRGAWGVADQALMSLTNFATLVFIARSVSPASFGLFSLALTAITLEMALAASVLNQPFTVISASRSGSGYRRYLTSVLLAQAAFATLATLPVVLSAVVAAALGWKIAALIVMVAPAMVAWQLQEFLRDALYVESRLPAAFLNDVISYGSQLAAVVIASQAGVLTPVNCLAIVGATSGLAALVGLIQLRSSITRSLSRTDLVADNVENWRFGKWTLGGTVLSLTSNSAVPFVLAALSGAASAGVLRVMVTAMAPTRVLLRGLQMSFGPAAARVLEREGIAGLKALVKRMFFLTSPLMGGYCLLAALFSRPLLSLLYGERYTGYAWLLPLVSLSYLLVFAYTPIETALRSLRATDVLFRASVWNFLGLWVIGGPCIYFFQLSGAAVLYVTMPPIVGAVLWRRYRQETQAAAGVRTGGLLGVSGDEAQANLQ